MAEYSPSLMTKKFFTVPYIEGISERITEPFVKLNFVPAFRSLNKLNKIIKAHKDLISYDNRKNIVYCIKCNDCHAVYVGQTKRQLITRIKEHKDNINRPQDSFSVVSLHRMDENHDFTWNNIEILNREPYYYKRLISECLYIQSSTHTINIYTDTDLLSSLYRPLLEELSKV